MNNDTPSLKHARQNHMESQNNVFQRDPGGILTCQKHINRFRFYFHIPK